MRHAFTLAVRILRREWRAGEMRAVAAALVVAVGSVTGVGFLIDRMDKAMQMRAGELLAADLTVVSTQPIPTHYADEARRLGLRTANTLSFRSVVRGGEGFQLVEVKAVNENYPLRGRLRVAHQAFENGEVSDAVPAPGTVWIDSRLAGLSGGD